MASSATPRKRTDPAPPKVRLEKATAQDILHSLNINAADVRFAKRVVAGMAPFRTSKAASLDAAGSSKRTTAMRPQR